MQEWIHLGADALASAMCLIVLGYFKKYFKKTDHNEKRIDIHDRVVHEVHRIPFNSSSIVNERSDFPVLFYRPGPKREQ